MRITRASDTRSDSDDRRTLIRLPHPSLANDSAESQSSTTDSTFTDKILRLFGRFVCAGYLFYLLILIPNIRDGAATTAAWWTPVAIFAIFGTAMVLGLSTFLPQTIWIRRAAAINAIAYILVACAWWPAWTGEHVQGFGTWLANIPGVAGLATAAAWQPAWALLYLGVGVTLVQLINHAIREAPLFYLLIPDLSAALMFCTVFVAASVVALRTGQTLDATIASTHAAAAGAAAAAAKDVERERFNALIHDTVMSTLLAAARTDSDSTVAGQSRRTLARLDHLRSGVETAERLDPDAVLAQLRSAASEVDENVTFTSHVESNANNAEFPSEPVSALAGALSEALRNSKKHAGPDARRSVDAIVEETRMEVTVCDNGIGFDPRTVPTHRLGIAVSIHARVRSIPGGAADVASSPGAGTKVTLSWQRAEMAPR